MFFGLTLGVSSAAGAQTADTLNCTLADFPDREAAQAVYDADPSDPHNLDGNDNDGKACESLPSRQGGTPTTAAPGVPAAPGAPTPVTGASAPISVRSSPDLDCRDFEFQEDAQAFFNATAGDPYRLDDDNDRIACEALPRAVARPASKPTAAAPSAAVASNTDLDCRDFATQADAQAFFNATAGDPHGLDADKDGKACEAAEVAAATAAPTGGSQPFVDKDCGDFTYQEDAQALFNSSAGDPHRLDDDNDGIACEPLPKGGSKAATTKSGTTELPRTGTDLWKWLVAFAGAAFVVGGQLIGIGAGAVSATRRTR